MSGPSLSCHTKGDATSSSQPVFIPAGSSDTVGKFSLFPEYISSFVINSNVFTQVAKHFPFNLPTAPTATADLSQPTSSVTWIPAPPPTDPAQWPSKLSDQVRDDLVYRSPAKVDRDFEFPRSHLHRSFHYHHLFRNLANGEKVKRDWLTYSKQKNAVYCFCCKLFSRKSSKLATEGQNDWVNISAILKSHETSPDHVKHLLAWNDLECRLKAGKTIDHTAIALLQAEQNRWREVVKCLISIIQSLAERNLSEDQ